MTITVNINVHKQDDKLYADRIMVGQWLVYSTPSAGTSVGITADHLYYIDGYKIITGYDSPRVSDETRQQDLWVVMQWTRMAQKLGGYCEGCGRELSDPDGPDICLYGVSRRVVARAYVVCVECVRTLVDTTKLVKIVEVPFSGRE